MKAKADCFFEVSWEVCNKVGGIYTVITSKIQQMQLYYKQHYFTIGPYFPGKAITDKFQEKTPPDFMKDAFAALLKIGIRCYYGLWLVDGEPNTILIDYSGYNYKLNDIKTENWNIFKIDSINSKYHDYDEPILWSTCAGIFLEKMKQGCPNKKIAVQFHEWLAGGGLLYLKSRKAKIGTIFTTHATMLGRTLAANNVDLYGMLDKIDPTKEAYNYGIQEKFLTEKACALSADAFTTVSEITGIEATHFFSRKPDVLVLNGLDTHVFPTFDDASVKHKILKAKIKKFLSFYFFPYQSFELDETLIFFLAGRYEFQNKGIDVFIESLGQLNTYLKKQNSTKTIVAFIWVPTGIREIKPEILENRTYYEDIEDSVHDIVEEVKDRLVYGIVGKKEINPDFIFGKPLVKENQKRVSRFKRDGDPPLCTHNLYDEAGDAILNSCKANNLKNTKEDRVKVIFYPIYLNGADRLTDLTYYEGIMASHLGVFPSYYEPWGYTPMEAGGLGIASVTTDLAGFGRYIQNHTHRHGNPGIYVLERQNKSKEDVVKQLSSVFVEFVNSSKQDRIENKLRAKNLADKADWNILVQNYIEAHNLAVDKNG